MARSKRDDLVVEVGQPFEKDIPSGSGVCFIQASIKPNKPLIAQDRSACSRRPEYMLEQLNICRFHRALFSLKLTLLYVQSWRFWRNLKIHTPMKKLILPLLVAGAVAVPSMAQAESYYVSLSSGANLMNNTAIDFETPQPSLPNAYTYKPGVVVNGAVGLKTGALRLEAEAGFHDNKVDKIKYDAGSVPQANFDVTIWTFMANGYYDMEWISSSVTPYVMSGLGSARLERNYYPDPADHTNSSTQTSVVFAWQVGAGFGIKVSKNITIDLAYRYLKPVDHKIDSNAGIQSWTFGGREILAGLRYSL